MSTSRHAKTVQVYSYDLSTMLTLKASSVVQWPPKDASTPRPMLCRAFMHNAACARGTGCPYVHAHVHAKHAVVEKKAIHVNYAWRGLEEVSYERLPAGKTLKVAQPNSHAREVTMYASEHLLKTRGSAQLLRACKRDAPSHCAHYRYNRVCNLGADCHFIHTVFIDPTAKPGQKAPAPIQQKQAPAATLASGELPPAPQALTEALLRTVEPSGASTPSATETLPCLSSAPSVADTDEPVSMFRYDPYSGISGGVSKLQML